MNAANQSGYRPLHWAASYGHRWLIESFLLRSANPSVRNCHGLLPSECAFLRGKQLVVGLLDTLLITDALTLLGQDRAGRLLQEAEGLVPTGK